MVPLSDVKLAITQSLRGAFTLIQPIQYLGPKVFPPATFIKVFNDFLIDFRALISKNSAVSFYDL